MHRGAGTHSLNSQIVGWASDSVPTVHGNDPGEWWARREGRAFAHPANAAIYFAPAFCAYSQEAIDSGTVRFADSIALALAAVPSRTRPAMPCVMPASRNKL